MKLTREDAVARIDELQLANESACDLAHLASLSARAEPELLRKLRLDVLPSASASAEADFWFSDVVAARSTSWLLLRPEVAEVMRERCAARLDWERLLLARSIIKLAHEKASPLVQLEDEIHWATMRGDTVAMDAQLDVLLKALRSANAEAAARWTVRAMPRWSSVVRSRPGAWLARFIAEQHLGESVRFEPGTESVPPEVAALVRGALSSTDVWARPIEGGMELSRQPLIGAQRFSAPLTEPVVVELDRPRERIAIPRDKLVVVPRDRSVVTMKTIDGALHQQYVKDVAARDSTEIRWALVANMMSDDSRYSGIENLHVDLLFVAGDMAPRGDRKKFQLAHDRLVLGRPRTLFLAVPGNHDVDFQSADPFANYLEFAQRFPTPRYFKRGKQPGDFVATLDINGVRIGVVGLNAVWEPDRHRFEWSQIEALCGPEPEEWRARHHFTILLSHYASDDRRIADLFSIQMISNQVIAGGVATRLDVWPRAVLQPTRSGPNGEGVIHVSQTVARMTMKLRGYAIADAEVKEFSINQPVTERELVAPERWVLIAGIAKANPRVAAVAREVGAALANAGYGLLTGGWPGVDEAATSGFAAAHFASSEELQQVIRHYVGRIEPTLDVPGRRLFFDSDHAAVEKSVVDASAVILISGSGGTEWIAEEALRRQRPIIPIIATGGAARRIASLHKMRFESLRDEEASAVTLAGRVVIEIDDAVRLSSRDRSTASERLFREFADITAQIEKVSEERRRIETQLIDQQDVLRKFQADLMKAKNQQQHAAAWKNIYAARKDVKTLEEASAEMSGKLETLKAKLTSDNSDA